MKTINSVLLTSNCICIFKFRRYSNRPWLEYSKESDAAFCFVCRVYGRAAVKDQAPAFVTTGYSNWKTALESGSGFLQHAVAEVHLDAMESWVEHDSRILTDKTVGQQLNSEQLRNDRLQSLLKRQGSTSRTSRGPGEPFFKASCLLTALS